MMRIKYASDMFTQCAFAILKWCAYLNAFHMRIKDASMILSLTLIHRFLDMRFKCISDAHQKCWNALMRRLKRFKCVSCSLGCNLRKVRRTTISFVKTLQSWRLHAHYAIVFCYHYFVYFSNFTNENDCYLLYFVLHSHLYVV